MRASRPHHFNLITSHFWAIFVSASKQSRRKFSARRMEKLSDSTALLGKTHHRATQHRTAQRRQSSSFVFQLCVFSSFLSLLFFTRGNEKSADSRARDKHARTQREFNRTVERFLVNWWVLSFPQESTVFLCGMSFSLSEKLSEFPSLTICFSERANSRTLVPACLNFNPNSIHWTGCVACEDEGRGLFCVPSWYILFIRYILKSPPTQAHQLKNMLCYIQSGGYVSFTKK